MPRRPHANAPGKAQTPSERATRTCERCHRPFTWRRKWARDWETVRYCSDKCRMGKSAQAS